jgi:AcrR family transcriptional regulator
MVRAEQVQATRDLLMSAAERLFAEHGVAAVSARQISEAAGQGNTAAVGYHFGDKTSLVQEILRKHTADIEAIRTRMTAEAAAAEAAGTQAGTAAEPGPSANEDQALRDWVGCLVRPTTEHLAALGAPTWFARFGAQVLTDPQLRPVLMEEAARTPAVTQSLRGVQQCLTRLPARVRAERNDMANTLIVHVVAEHERLLSAQAGSPSSWDETASGLIDAIVGLYTAPVTSTSTSERSPEEGKR